MRQTDRRTYIRIEAYLRAPEGAANKDREDSWLKRVRKAANVGAPLQWFWLQKGQLGRNLAYLDVSSAEVACGCGPPVSTGASSRSPGFHHGLIEGTLGIPRRIVSCFEKEQVVRGRNAVSMPANMLSPGVSGGAVGLPVWADADLLGNRIEPGRPGLSSVPGRVSFRQLIRDCAPTARLTRRGASHRILRRVPTVLGLFRTPESAVAELGR